MPGTDSFLMKDVTEALICFPWSDSGSLVGGVRCSVVCCVPCPALPFLPCQLDNILPGLNTLCDCVTVRVGCIDCVVDILSHYHSNNPNIHTEYNTEYCNSNFSHFN